MKYLLCVGAMMSCLLAPDMAWTGSFTSFQDALVSTWLTHPLVKGKNANYDAAVAIRNGDEWQRFPTLSLEVSLKQQHRSYNLLRLDQPLWTGGRITSSIEASTNRVQAASYGKAEIKRDLAFRVIAAYAEALRQKGRVEFAEKSAYEHSKLLAMIQHRVGRNVSSMTDQRLAESRLYSVMNDLSLTRQSHKNALAKIEQLAGTDVGEVLDLNINDSSFPKNINTLLMLGRDYDPTVKRLKMEENAAKNDITIKKSVYMPQLLLRLERSENKSLTQHVIDSRAMFVLQINSGAGLSAKSAVDAAEFRYEVTRNSRKSAERDVDERITLDWNEWIAAQMRVENSKGASLMSSEVFNSYVRQYAIGRKSWLDVLNAVREVMLAQFYLKDSESQALAARLRLSAETGLL